MSLFPPSRRLSFTGQRQDTVSGLYDFPAREYSIQGRWPSPDPAGLAAVDPANPQSWNRYAYVMNNPLVFTDPTGLVCDGGDQTMWDTLANGTGIFTQDDCTANGGTWEGPAAGTILTDPTYVTADPLPSPWAPWGPDLSGILTGSSGGGTGGIIGTVKGALQYAADRNRCAADNAGSAANVLGISKDNFIGQSLLGNDFSSISH